MACTIAALSFGGKWCIHDKDSINTSFPSFLKKISFFEVVKSTIFRFKKEKFTKITIKFKFNREINIDKKTNFI